MSQVDDALLMNRIVKAQDDRLFYLAEALRRGFTIEELHQKRIINLTHFWDFNMDTTNF